jgi:hypothetical protein
MEDMTSMMVVSKGSLVSRRSCECRESTTHVSGVGSMEYLYDSTSSGQGTTQGSIYLRDPLVNVEIMFIGVTFIVGVGRGRRNIPMSERYLNIPTPTLI